MEFFREWYPTFMMIVIDFALAVVNLLLTKVTHEGMDHLVLITYRTSIAAISLGPVAYFWERKSRPTVTTGILFYLFISALIGATLTQYFFLLGIQYTSATFACAFINMVPVITFVLALPFRLETLDMRSNAGRAKMLGTLVCVGGAMVLTLYRGIPLTNLHQSSSGANMTYHASQLSSNKRTQRWTLGSIYMTASALLWASWFLIQAQISKRFRCNYSSTAIMNLFSCLQSAILSLIIHRDLSVWSLKGKTEILTVIYAGIVGSGLCYVGMSWCVQKRGPLFTSAFSPLIQIFVAIFDFTILHEQLHLGSVIGSIFVILGLYILLWGKSKEAKVCLSKPRQATVEEGHQEPSI